jgi:hypothetical protein
MVRVRRTPLAASLLSLMTGAAIGGTAAPCLLAWRPQGFSITRDQVWRRKGEAYVLEAAQFVEENGGVLKISWSIALVTPPSIVAPGTQAKLMPRISTT